MRSSTRAVVLLILTFLPVRGALGQFIQISEPGFGDRQNGLAWSMQWFKGKLYVGTARNVLCVTGETLNFYFSGLGLYNPLPDPYVPCPADPADLDLRAEIWCYTPETGTWARVFQSPSDVPNPSAPGKFVARDIGFRSMVVFQEQDGTEALYVMGVTLGEILPGLPPPRILRTTDGLNFQMIPQDPGTFMGSLKADGYRATAIYNGRLYVTATSGLLGDGVVLEASHPAGGNNNFRRISPPDLHVYEMEVFNGSLYIGAGDVDQGYSVWKTTATGTPPYVMTPVVTGGAGRGLLMTSVISMHVFKGRLYVGSSGAPSVQHLIIPSTELIRINPDDTWEVVVGNPRLTPRGLLFPISGLPDGFGWPFNFHIWRMQDHEGALYAGTFDASWYFRWIPGLGPLIQSEYGFDLYMSENGVSWKLITRNGFGLVTNSGVRTFASTPWGLFLGSANDAAGAVVWLGQGAAASEASLARLSVSLGPRSRGIKANARSAANRGQVSLLPPGRLAAEKSGAIVLSWDPPPGAVRFHVFRSDHRRIELPRQPDIPGAPSSSGPGAQAPMRDLLLPGPFRRVGTTDQAYFRDLNAADGATHAYYVQAEYRWGRASMSSNVTVVSPMSAPAVTFDAVRAAIQDLANRRRCNAEGAAGLLELLEQGRAATARGDLPGAQRQLQTLHGRVARNEGRILDAQGTEDLEAIVAKLARRVDLIRSGALSRDALDRRDDPRVEPPIKAPVPTRRAPARRARPVVSTPEGR